MSDSNSKTPPNVVVKQKTASPTVVKDTTPDPTPVAASLVEPSAPAEVEVLPVTVTPPVVEVFEQSHDAATVVAMLAEYVNVMNHPIVTDAGISRGVLLLARATEVVCTSPNDDTRDVMWAFHSAEKDRLMREDLGLRGVRNLVNGKQAAMVATTYSMYRHRVLNTKMRIDDEKAKDATSLALVLYFESKK